MEDKMQNGRFSLVLNKAKPYLAMGSLQVGFAGMYVITKFSLQHGMNHYILADLVSTIVIAPFALVLERSDLNCLVLFL